MKITDQETTILNLNRIVQTTAEPKDILVIHFGLKTSVLTNGHWWTLPPSNNLSQTGFAAIQKNIYVNIVATTWFTTANSTLKLQFGDQGLVTFGENNENFAESNIPAVKISEQAIKRLTKILIDMKIPGYKECNLVTT